MKPKAVIIGTGKILLLLALFLGFSVKFLDLRDTVRLHVDETFFIQRSLSFRAIQYGDWTADLWHEDRAYIQPRLAEYMYGGWFYLLGHRDLREYLTERRYLDYTVDPDGFAWEVTIANRLPYDRLSELHPEARWRVYPVTEARQISFLIQILTGITVLLIGITLRHWLFGFFSTLLIWMNPLFQSASTRAMADGLLLLTILLHFLCSLWFLQAVRLRRRSLVMGTTLLLCSISALSLSTKLNGILTVVYFVLLAGYALRTNLALAVKVVLPYLLGCFLLFYLLNPTLWGRPLEGTKRLFAFRLNDFKAQQSQYTHDAIPRLAERPVYVYWRTLAPQATFGAFPSRLPVNIILFLLGTGVLLRQTVRRGHTSLPDREYARGFLLWLACLAGITMLNLPLDWDRYYLPIVVAILFPQAAALSALGELAGRRLEPILSRLTGS